MTTGIKLALTLIVLLAAAAVLVWRVKLMRALVLGVAFGSLMAVIR